jgi:hypothetical protein
MLQSSSTGLKTRQFVAQTLRWCLPDSLPYNWDEKLRGLIVDICIARSLVLQSIAQVRCGHVRTRENALSAFLGYERLKIDGAQSECVKRALKRMGRRRLWKQDGKVALVIDGTSYAKARSRGKKRGMPGKGQVRVHNVRSQETILVPGYQEIWVGVLLKDQTVLPLTRRLWSENGPDTSISMNLVEEVEIRRAVAIIRETFKMGAILVADSGYRRKSLLHWLKAEGADFVIRLEGKLLVKAGRSRGLLDKLSEWWPKRTQVQWRETSKRLLLSDVSARSVSARTEGDELIEFNALRLTPIKTGIEPMYLATTLPIDTNQELIRIARLYSWRWGIETFFWKFKQAFRADSWRVFSSWEAIDRLLTAAHIAYLTLLLFAEFVRRGQTVEIRALRRQFDEVLRRRFARWDEQLTLGRFMRLVAMDFPYRFSRSENPGAEGAPAVGWRFKTP